MYILAVCEVWRIYLTCFIQNVVEINKRIFCDSGNWNISYVSKGALESKSPNILSILEPNKLSVST